ncbi:histidinol dehydrogenase [Amycolatopsis rhabdoformis]|uniref:Histidinol dehydrogenase n=1 Tax=Amycolatopsis rhabdoformis TaxID=1448059 RepID=A0ABZ1IIB8_9PSEU|nr:histidinol dehydrogenase [Amycolatopsis rhabdoformis]WSE34137.1 histidinol dehydrogenase [Amycolatopsis rhabdoformis]
MGIQLKQAARGKTTEPDSAVSETVSAVIADIRARGDEAVREYSAKFDHWSPERFRLDATRIDEIVATVPAQVLDDIGEGTCVSYGDKVIGTNHTLPTRGAARYTGGLWVGKFLRTVTYQEVTDPESSAALGELCGRAARAEFFEGHARSGDVRAAKAAGRLPDWADGAGHASR